MNRIGPRLLTAVFGIAVTASLLGACVPGPGPDPWSGNRTNPLVVILWDPHLPDNHVRPTVEQVDQLLFGPAPSLADYYSTESNGLFQVEKTAILGWYDADKPADHYWNHPQPGQPGSDGFLSGHVEKWTEAIRKASADFDFSQYDTNHDGVLDVTELAILILIPQTAPFGSNRHTAGRETPDYQPLKINGLEFGMIAEVYTGSGSPSFPGIPMNFGVNAHELGHLFHHFPDLYGAGNYGSGAYSIMDVCYTDAQIDPYDKLKQGWLDVVDATASGVYALTSVEESHEVISITRTGHAGAKESFVIENRQHGVYDTKIPDTGLAIWDLIEDESVPNWVGKNIRLLRRGMLQSGLPQDAWALWHAPEGPSVSLKWADGTDSGITLHDIPVSAKTMTFSIDIPAAAGARP